LKADILSGLDALVVIDAWQTETARAAHVTLPATGPYEADGVIVNFQGRAQRLRRGVPAPGLAEPSWRRLRELGRRFGLAGSWSAASAVFDQAASELKPLASLSWRGLSGDGHPLVEIDAALSGGGPAPGTQALEP